MKKFSLQFSVMIFVLIVFSSCSYGSQIDGIWETNMNGMHLVVVYAEDEYCCCENTFQLSDDLNHLIIVRQDGFSLLFSRMQANARPPAVMRRPPANARRKCNVCHGSGRCTLCFGKGRSYVAGYGGVGSGSYVECSACNGSGRCWHCDGKGRE